MKLPLSSIVLAALLLAACGQSGDLYLPDNPPPEVRKREEAQKKRAQERTQQQQEPQQKAEPAAPAPQTSQEPQ